MTIQETENVILQMLQTWKLAPGDRNRAIEIIIWKI